MKAVILAAGRGSRMAGLTQDRPKCFVMLGGKTLLQRQIGALEDAGIDEIAIVTGYRAESFEPLGRRTFHNARWETTNMVVSLEAAAPWLAAEPTIVSYSDIFYTGETVCRLAQSDAPIAISYDSDWLALWSRRFDDPYSDAESFRIDPGGRLLEIGKKHPAPEEVAGQYMGLLKFRPEGWQSVVAETSQLTNTERDLLDMTSLLARLLAKGTTIAGIPASGRWGEVDSERDLRLYEEMFHTAHG